MRYGMAICLYTLENCPNNNELFFAAIAQINQGDTSVISDPSQRTILAKMNLKAGKLSIILSDYASASSLFDHGKIWYITTLGNVATCLENITENSI